jgi:hypothetical protein
VHERHLPAALEILVSGGIDRDAQSRRRRAPKGLALDGLSSSRVGSRPAFGFGARLTTLLRDGLGAGRVCLESAISVISVVSLSSVLRALPGDDTSAVFRLMRDG